jgi:hypothetical protein
MSTSSRPSKLSPRAEHVRNAKLARREFVHSIGNQPVGRGPASQRFLMTSYAGRYMRMGK